MKPKPFSLIVEDDKNDAFLYQHAFAGLGISNYFIVHDGADAIDYLGGEGKFIDRKMFPFPDWLLLDLKMPLVNGFEVLEWIRGNETCSTLPIIVISSSNDPLDVARAYGLGAKTYFCKRTQIQDTIRMLSLLEEYWGEATYLRFDPKGNFIR